jgi:excisionase family DNA binding protein
MEQLALTVAEACAAARIGRTTLYEAIKRGDLVAAKYGRKTLIRVDDLRKWLARLPTVGAKAIPNSTFDHRGRQHRS